MDLARPERVLASPGALDVLMLLTRAGGPLDPGDLADRAGPDAGAVLDELAAHGLTIAGGRGVGLNRDHVLVMALEQLAAASGRVVERLRFHVGTWDPAPELAAVVGSAARGAGGPHADVDLLLVRPTAVAADPRWAAQTAAVARDVLAWTGNRAHLIELDALGAGGLPAGAVVLAGGAAAA